MDPGTINSDDEIEYFDDADNEMEEKIYTKKERQQTRLVLCGINYAHKSFLEVLHKLSCL